MGPQWYQGERYLWTHVGTMRIQWSSIELSIVHHWRERFLWTHYFVSFSNTALVSSSVKGLIFASVDLHTLTAKQQPTTSLTCNTCSRRRCVEISPLTLRILSLQKGRWSFALRAPRLSKVGGAAMQVARCQDTTATVKVQTATKVPGYVFSYLPSVIQPIFTVLSGCG